MPRYFFNLLDRAGTVIKDTDGSLFVDDAAARDQAKAGARELIAEALRHRRPLDIAAIEVQDEGGQKLCAVELDVSSLLGLLESEYGSIKRDPPPGPSGELIKMTLDYN